MTTFHKHLKSNSKGALEFEGIAIPDLAAQYGSPLFVLSENTIRENYRRIHRAFADVYPTEVSLRRHEGQLGPRRAPGDRGRGRWR
jgi:hypothetical protein